MKLKLLALAVLSVPALLALQDPEKAALLHRYRSLSSSAQALIGYTEDLQREDEAAGKKAQEKHSELSKLREELEKNRCAFSKNELDTIDGNIRNLMNQLMNLELQNAPDFSARSAFASRT